MLRRWRLVFRYLPPYRRAIAVGFVTLAVSSICFVLVPVLFRRGLRAIEEPMQAGEPVRIGIVAGFAAAGVGLALLGGLTSFFKRYLLMGTSRQVETDLRRDLFRHIQRLPLSYLSSIRTGDLMSRATADIEAVRMAIGPGTMYVADSLLSFGLAVSVMLQENAELTAYALLPLLGICASLFFFAPRIHRASRAVQEQLASISSRSQESFAGGRVVKTFAIEEREHAELERRSTDYIDANLRLARVRGLTVVWIGLMGAIGLALVLWIGGRMAIAGRFDISGLLMFNQLQLMLVWPMMAFGWVLSMVQRGAAGLERIGAILEHPEEAGGEGAGTALSGEIEIDGLTFAYDGGPPVLRDVSVRVPAGTTLGVVGPTGSGKSTLVHLLARLYDPPRGRVRVDGRDVHEIPLADLRGALAFVPQEPFLFSATLRENVAFARPDATADEIDAAVRDARLHRDLEGFPRGLETVVGERGVTLSGGQKQRVALARALVARAPVLVLDDALSAVDTETEAAILENLRRVRRGRTAVVVAHRVSAIQDADHIVYLRDGRVVERGTHAELVAAGGEYARLARAQALEAEIEAME